MVALGLCDSVLANFVQQRLVADLQDRRSLLAVPVCLLQSAHNCFRLGFIFGAAGNRFQTAAIAILRRGIGMRAAVTVILGLQFGDGQILVS